MERNTHFFGIFHTLRHILSHIGVTLLAVGIAFSLPVLAKFILFTWWPMVEGDSQLLLINEIIFAAVLVLLFNLFLSARQGRLSRRMIRLISLVHVREEGNWLSRWTDRTLLDRNLLNRISGTRDVSVMSVTGYDTFVSKKRNLGRVIDHSYELRVMLMNPYGAGAMRRVQSLGDPAPLLETYCQETAATVERLASLASAGKQVTLKFYDDPPFWNLIVTGEYVWVQYCHDGEELKTQPEYVFALHKDKPRQGLFSAFYVHFLNQWSDPRHPEYDFSTRELIYRNDKGNEVKRLPFEPQAQAEPGPHPAGELTRPHHQQGLLHVDQFVFLVVMLVRLHIAQQLDRHQRIVGHDMGCAHREAPRRAGVPVRARCASTREYRPDPKKRASPPCFPLAATSSLHDRSAWRLNAHPTDTR